MRHEKGQSYKGRNLPDTSSLTCHLSHANTAYYYNIYSSLNLLLHKPGDFFDWFIVRVGLASQNE
jgi:hypothetical protein